MIRCDYCGEEEIYTKLIVKPNQFFWDGRVIMMVSKDLFDMICLDCLSDEMEMLKECY